MKLKELLLFFGDSYGCRSVLEKALEFYPDWEEGRKLVRKLERESLKTPLKKKVSEM
jgi:hypothetical protein